MPRLVMMLAIMALVLAAACAPAATPTKAPAAATPGAAKPAAGETEIALQNSAFNPKTVTVPRGTTVRWTNKDSVDHTASARQGTFESGNMKKDGTFTFKFDQAGAFEYFCKYHANMTGTITVQ